jgi:hypothetical protein
MACLDSFVWFRAMMDLRVSGFDGDDGNRAKCQKHGVSITEVAAYERESATAQNR